MKKKNKISRNKKPKYHGMNLTKITEYNKIILIHKANYKKGEWNENREL